ncbi:RluA family pseudouridine synthase [Aquamicrobium segne]|uniref:Pseudouridine synthase n=1 Tax=Aquamicrobium segne TaxID=469547 RepID=A0ABW0H108_9HYPH
MIEGQRRELVADAQAASLRLDQWLAAQLAPDLSRSRIQALIRQGAVRIGGHIVHEPKHRLAEGEQIAVTLPGPQSTAPQGEPIPLDILYEDEDLIVINKPAGLVVHPGAGNETGTLVNALIWHCGDHLSTMGGERRRGIVHRLDKDTSGVLVAAKTDHAHEALAQAFADHGRKSDLERAYTALVWGIPEHMSGTIDAPLGRAPDRVRRAVVPPTREDARHAITHFQVEERFGEDNARHAPASLVECRLETGRTHQIRVHLAHIGHPVIGDRDYGQAFATKANRLPPELKELVSAFPRQALHARLLAFRHPTTHMLMRFEAPLPADMAALVSHFHQI